MHTFVTARNSINLIIEIMIDNKEVVGVDKTNSISSCMLDKIEYMIRAELDVSIFLKSKLVSLGVLSKEEVDKDEPDLVSTDSFIDRMSNYLDYLSFFQKKNGELLESINKFI